MNSEKPHIQLSIEGLSLANLFVTKQLVSTLIENAHLTQPPAHRETFPA